MKIALVTAAWGDLEYLKYSAIINSAYCKRHGYDWHQLKFDNRLPQDRSSLWAKVSAVEEVLPRYDLVVSMDGDAWVHDPKLPVDQLANRMHETDFMLIGTDRRDAGFAWNDKAANVGVFAIRNTEVARHVLREWWHVPLYAPHTAHGWPPEQAAFNEHIYPRWNRYIRLIPYNHLNGHDGYYIRHLAGMLGNPGERARIISEAAKEQGLL